MTNIQHLTQLVEIIADALTHNSEIEASVYSIFFQSPELCLPLLDSLYQLEDKPVDEDNNLLSAHTYALEMCLGQLQSEYENGARHAGKIINQCMHKLSELINQGKHSLPFWLPILNAFYDVGVELTDELKGAYLELANQGYHDESESEADPIEAIRALIAQSSELSIFEIAENFFSQTYALPAEFFFDLIIDLMSLPEGQDIGLLFLLHPDTEVRDYVMEALDEVLPNITLSSPSLSRMQTITKWYPNERQPLLNGWIKQQRKKGVTFAEKSCATVVKLKATEIDGVASQGLFIHLREKRKHKLCGLLLKLEAGIKDVWITQDMAASEIKSYYTEALQDSVTLRNIDLTYLTQVLNHFLALTLAKGSMPNLSLLHLIELLDLSIQPQAIDSEEAIEKFSLQISPFTQDAMHKSFARSKRWSKTKQFTESWYAESVELDKIVNQHCSIVEGIKVCDFEAACDSALNEVFEKSRDKWLFHFLWTALWLHSGTAKNEKMWQDSTFIAYALLKKIPMAEIPLICQICAQSVANSIETMQERKTHLS